MSMITRKMVVIAVAVQFMAIPAMAQGTTDQGNAHHYQGGPKTGVPHSTTHPKLQSKKTRVNTGTGGHHYQGGPKTEVPHHMGDKK
ncbi:hypothetical protein HNQ36_005334 [Afipia massiliensis]|uniref:Uncharacterized protein n=1 Tax=Afipia massiliensis TaxID=211460 RepID=A0A840N5I3_9BRAD|nr:hypothetical protein [Afipia massiliensis]